MRIEAATLVSASAQRLKALLPSLPASVQAEMFLIYSTLKHLAREVECRQAAELSGKAAYRRWLQRLRKLVLAHQGLPWAHQLDRIVAVGGAEKREGDCRGTIMGGSMVAAIMDEMASAEYPEWVVEKLMDWTVRYLAECNESEMAMFRERSHGADRREEKT